MNCLDGSEIKGWFIDLPIDCWNLIGQLALLGNVLLPLDICINALSLLHRGDSSTHPGGTASKLVVGGEHRPVESISQGHQSIDGAHGLVVDEALGKLTKNGLSGSCGIGVVVVVGRDDGP